MTSKLWFRAKTYGYGWTPSTWEGWLVTVLYVVFEVALSLFLDLKNQQHGPAVLWFIVITLIATALFIYIAYKKGEKPRWRWGGR